MLKLIRDFGYDVVLMVLDWTYMALSYIASWVNHAHTKMLAAKKNG